jgi:hypothetical protein
VAVAAFGLSSIWAAGDAWSPERAARYLDARLQQWFEWKPAAAPEGPCVSCHTGMTYLMARPALRRRLGEERPTRFETGLLDRLRSDVGDKPESYLQGPEVIFAAFFLSERDAGRSMSPETEKALNQLWSLQLTEGPSRGSWEWLTVDLDPWEHAESAYFGAALAALAAENAGASYARRKPVASHLAALTMYLREQNPARRPLHDRLALLWAASKRQDLLSSAERRSLMTEIFGKQHLDGGWTNESLGPWTPHPGAPEVSGSSGFATGFTAFVLQRTGVSPTDPRLARALDWLITHQNRETGAWPAVSMNKHYPVGSMQSLFMQDAATAFASLALIEAGR